METGKLIEAIRLHRLWMLGDATGRRLELPGADLHDADLGGADPADAGETW